MWVVSGLDLCTREEHHSVSCMYLGDVDEDNHEILSVRLYNTKSHDSVMIYSSAHKEFSRALHRYKPYGWVPAAIGGKGKFDGKRDELFVAIDKQSLDFLDCVDKVEVLYPGDLLEKFDYKGDPNEFCRRLGLSFNYWDSMYTLLEWDYNYCEAVSTLFQVICFLKDNWVEDEFYIKGSHSVFCVSFSDIRKARALLGKAVFSNYNPLEEKLSGVELPF